ncbi:MAG TPA: immunoglobulin domain-containing protein, partial [Verrucomicrobiae bacterium]
TATLTLNAVTATDAGSYTVRVTNAGGNVTSSAAMLTVNPVIVGPAITTQPASQTVLAGANVSFTVVATGTAPLSYQWMKNGGNIAGATTATLTLNAVTATDAGSYTVRVTNAGGNVTSSAAMLTVNPVVTGPTITTQPANRTVTAGTSVSFSVVATGTAPLSYQWMKNGGNIAGATTATLTLNNVTATDAGSYTVRVSNTGGSVTSAAAMLTVNPVVTLSITLDSPTAGATFVTPADVTLAATVNPTTGIANVQFFDGTTSLGTVTASPYTLTATLVTVGEHMLTAQVTDTQGHTALSQTVRVTVTSSTTGNLPPVVQMVAPANNARYSTRSRILLVAQATDSDGSVASVEFFAGGTRIGAGVPFHDDDGEEPGGGDDHEGGSGLYYLEWIGVSAGEYDISAKATDNLGAVTTSNPVHITVQRRTYEFHDERESRRH